MLACTGLVLMALPGLDSTRAFVLGASLAVGWGVLAATAWGELRRRS
jgi:hypothetical protein